MNKRSLIKPAINLLLPERSFNTANGLFLVGVEILNISTGSEDLINEEIKSAVEDFGKYKDISITAFLEDILQIMQ